MMTAQLCTFLMSHFPLFHCCIVLFAHCDRYGDGCIYQGNWEDGLEEGVGQMTFPTGDMYKGNFRRGLKQGRGLYLFKNGDEFRGSFMTNQKHGPGKYTWKDGDTYEATFEHGKVRNFDSLSSLFFPLKIPLTDLIPQNYPSIGGRESCF